MLDSDAYSKGFLFQRNPLFLKHPEGIPGAVARRKHKDIRFQFIDFFSRSPAAGHLYALYPAFLQSQIRHLAFKADLSAQGLYPAASRAQCQQRHGSDRGRKGFRQH